MKKIIFLFSILISLTSQSVVISNRMSEVLKRREMFDNNSIKLNKLLKEFERDKITGIEVIIADPSSNRVESRWGHIMLRFLNTTPRSSDDITLSFVADVYDNEVDHLGGVTGKYAVYPLLKSFRQFYTQYIKGELRSLKRVIIPTDKAMRYDLIHTLTKWNNDLSASLQDALSSATKNAYKSASTRAKDLYEFYQLFPIKNDRNTIAIAIVEKDSEDQLLTESQLSKRHYKSALETSLSSLKKYKNDKNIVLNFGHKLILAREGESILNFSNTDVSNANELAKEVFGERNFILLKNTENNTDFIAVRFKAGDKLEENIQIVKQVDVSPIVEVIDPQQISSKELGKYTFFSNNCAGALVNYLKKSNFPHRSFKGIVGRIPVKMHKWLKKSLLSPYPETMIEKMALAHERFRKALTPKSKVFNLYALEEYQLKWIIDKASTQEVALFLDGYPHLDDDIRQLMLERLDGKTYLYDELHGIKLIPNKLYQLCSDKKCSKEAKVILANNFSSKDISDAKKKAKKVGRLRITESLLNRDQVLKHLDLLGYLNRRMKKRVK